MKRTKTCIAGAIALMAIGTGWLLLRNTREEGIALETAPTSRITIRNSVMATGTVEPVTEVEVGTQVSGIIDRLYVDYNDQVKAGQLIAEMDKVTLQAELEQSEAELASCRNEYEYQTKNYARTRTLHEKELVSDAEYDEAFYLYEKARNAYEQAQAAIVKVKRNGLCNHHIAHRRSGHQPLGRGGTDRRREFRDSYALHHSPRPDADAGCSRRR